MTYRAAIVGTGDIARSHIAALRDRSDVSAVAAIDVADDRVREFARTWEIPRTFTSLADALASEDIDVVHLCTPPATHLPLAREALSGGVHVLLEKPPALSLAEHHELISATDSSTATASVIFQHRFGSGATVLRQLASAGKLGKSTVTTCDTQWYRDDAYYAVPWHGTWAAEGGGPTMGHGIHQFDLMLSVLGRWEQVSSMTARRTRPVETEDISAAVVQFASGALATVVNSVVSPRQESRLRFDFEFATIELVHLYGYDDAAWTFTPAPGHEELAEAWAGLLTGRPSGHAAQFDDYYRALSAGRVPEVSARNALHTLEFAAAIYASAAQNRAVSRTEMTASSAVWRSMNPGRTARAAASS